jgi:hypothetical protein
MEMTNGPDKFALATVSHSNHPTDLLAEFIYFNWFHPNHRSVISFAGEMGAEWVSTRQEVESLEGKQLGEWLEWVKSFRIIDGGVWPTTRACLDVYESDQGEDRLWIRISKHHRTHWKKLDENELRHIISERF